MTPDDGTPECVQAAAARPEGAARPADGPGARADGIRRRYARWMTAYPPAWRREHGEALLGTFLDAADARGGTGPTGAEAAGILKHGLAWRLRLLAPSEPTRRLASILALGSGTAASLAAFVVAEWQPGVAATGWRVEPGHVGPFATLGVLVYSAWFAGMVAVLAGRPGAARRLLAAALVISGLLAGTVVPMVPDYLLGGSVRPPAWDTVLGLRRPAGWMMVSMAGLSALALLGRLRLTPVERVVTLLGGLAGAGLLARVVLDAIEGSEGLDPAFVLYRRAGFFEIVFILGYEVVPAVALVAALAWRWRPTWFPAVLLWSFAVLPYAAPPRTVPRSIEIWVNRFSYDPVDPPAVLDSVIGWGGALLVVLAVVRRWRRGRPGTGASTVSGAAGVAR